MLSKKAKTKAKTASLELVEQQLSDVIKEPTNFLRAQPALCAPINQLIQNTYKASIQQDEQNSQGADYLPELVVQDMDEEQIWQQIELRNNAVLQQLLEQTSKMLALKEQKLEIRLNEDEEDTEVHEEQQVEESDDEQAEQQSDDLFVAEDKPQQQKKKKYRATVVDDKFFKLAEMHEFLEAEDAKELRKQSKQQFKTTADDGIDYFAADLGDEYAEEEEQDDDVNARYADFFADEEGLPTRASQSQQKDHFVDTETEDEDMPDETDEQVDENNEEVAEMEDDEDEGESAEEAVGKKHDDDEDDDDDDDDDDDNDNAASDKPKSSFEIRQARLQQRIAEYEQEVLGEKPWQLKGEIQATNRPQNSLLEEVLEFESTTRPAPVITEQTTLTLEEIIKQRIKDKAWDDPVRIIAPIQTPQDYRKQLVLDQEKSKESLAHIYEKEYQRELEKLQPQENADTAEAEEPKAHKELRSKMNALFIKLDALSNFHFMPKPIAPEATIVTNTPAIEMEEVAPVAVSNAKLLAPEEIYRGPKHELLGKTERSRTDKNRERRKKKQKQRAIHKALEAKDERRQKLGIPLTKQAENAKLLKNITKHRNVQKLTVSGDQKALKSSTAFFSKLQDTTSNVSNGTAKATKQKAAARALSAKKLKL